MQRLQHLQTEAVTPAGTFISGTSNTLKIMVKSRAGFSQ